MPLLAPPPCRDPQPSAVTFAVLQPSAVSDPVLCCAPATVVASEKGVVVGRLTFTEDGDDIDCRRMGVGGKAIPPNISKVCGCVYGGGGVCVWWGDNPRTESYLHGSSAHLPGLCVCVSVNAPLALTALLHTPTRLPRSLPHAHLCLTPTCPPPLIITITLGDQHCV